MKYIDEILSKKREMSEDEYEQELIKRINELEPEYSRSLKRIFLFRNLFDKDSKMLRKKFKEIRQKLMFLQKELDENYKYEGSIYNDMSYSIVKLDYLFKKNVYDSFYKLKIEKNPKKKLKLYRKVFVSLIEEFNNLDKDDYKNRKITKNIIDLMRYKIVKEKAKVKKLIQIESIKEKETEERIIQERVAEKNKVYLDITNPEIINKEDLKEVMDSFRNMIKNAPITEDFIDYIGVIKKRLINEDAMEDNFDLINSTIDYIKYRKYYLKKDKKEKNILRNCSNVLEELRDQIKLRNVPIVEAHDYKFDLIFELLKDQKNYQLIKKMVNDYPLVVNIRNNKRSILSYMLQLYLNNYMMILTEHKYNYNIDYLKEVYRLFASSNSLYLSYEDKMELDSIIDKFIYDINELDINSKKKNYVINDAKELYIESNNKENDYHKKIDKYMIDANMKDLEFLDPNHSKRSSEIDLTHEHTFMFDNPYICYSITSEKGILVLKVHTADLSNIIYEGSELDKYIYNCELDSKKINSTLSNYLEFKKGEVVSAFTYEIRDITNKSKNKKELKIYKSRIRIDGKLLDFASDPYVYRDLSKIEEKYISENGVVNLTGLNRKEFILTDILKKEYLKLTRNNNLPIITKKERKVPVIDTDTLSNIQVILNKMGKNKDSKKISSILEESITDKWFDSVTNYKDIGDLNITGNPNYIYLMNQRMIKLLLLNERQFTQEMYAHVKEKVIGEYSDFIQILNQISGHKTEEDFDYKKRRNYKSYVFKKEE